jgi:hypothetical protein
MTKATPEAKLLACLIIDTARVREASWIPGRVNESGAIVVGGYYAMEIQQAAEQVCALHDQPSLAMIVYLGLRWSWNEVFEWAQDVCPTANGGLS